MLIWYYGSYLGLPQEAKLASGNAVYHLEEVCQSWGGNMLIWYYGSYFRLL